ncbi:MAG: RNA polymerase sigma factor [Terriglobia bacterium]
MSTVPLSMIHGQGDAFANLYDEFYPRVLSVCRYMLGSPEDAEDASSEVFARLPRAIRTYNRALPFSRWLSAVASHHCVDLLRRRSLEQRVFAPPGPEQPEHAAVRPSPLDELLVNEKRKAVREVIRRLPEHYRAPLELRYFQELSYDEIAQTLHLTRANAKTLVFRAKKEALRMMNVNGK